MEGKYLFCISIFVILMSMTAVSASENINQTDSLGISLENNFKTAEYNQEINELTYNEFELKENENRPKNSNILGISNENEIIGKSINVTGNTFKDISDAIDGADGGDIIYLNGTYKNNGNGEIIIDKNISIVGKGNAILDAEKFSRIFHVTSNKITIQNITFINGKAQEGGAIYFENSIFNSTINANFINNTAYYGGGANFFGGRVSGSNVSGNYTRNTAYYGGGANFFGGRVSGSNVSGNYTRNTAEHGGGANYFMDSVSGLNVSGNYTCNTASRGGANFFWRRVFGLNVSGNYTGNTATASGGANFFWDSVSASNVTGTFTGNKANGQDESDGGGANYFYEEVSGSNVGGNYTNNTVKMRGGANLFGDSVSASNITGTYTNNKAEYDGGANYFSGNVSGLNVSGNYTGNTATINGGANYFSGNVSGLNVSGNYANNKAWDLGGANFFFADVSDSDVSGNYTGNTAAINGGANFFGGRGSGLNVSGNYINNTAEYGGGANFFSGSVSGLNVSGNYTGNTATASGGANFFEGSVSASNVTGTFTGNKANGQDESDGGGANFFRGSVSASNITGTYTNNTAKYDGGANCFWGSVSGLNVGGIYINNTADAIICFEDFFNEGLDADITNAIFLNNNCIYDIYASNQTVVVKDCWFGNNASDFMNKPNKIFNVQMLFWLFLNATADYSSLLVMDSSDIIFKLYSTDDTDVFPYDNSKLPAVNLSLSATKGDVDEIATFDNVVKYSATEPGKGSVTAKIENASYTIYFENSLRNVDLSVSAKNITYHENETLTLTYNNTATGKLNITLKSKNYNKTIECDINQTITIADLPAGEYDVFVVYFGDNVFLNDTAYATFIVDKKTTEVIPDEKSIDLFVDDESRITFTLNPDYAWGMISFSSDDSNIVSVSVSGDILAKAEGSAIITISFFENENYTASNATIMVNVKKIPTQIIVNSSFIGMEVNDEMDNVATLKPVNVGNLTYKSSDENIVKVENGIIQALKEGNATITVSFKGDDKYAGAENKTIKVFVTLIPAYVIASDLTLNVNGQDTIGAVTFPNNLKLIYVCADSTIAEVDSAGKVTGKSAGSTIINITIDGEGIYYNNNTCINVSVKLNDACVSVNNATLYLFVDDTFTIVPVTAPEGLNVTYMPDNSGVVSVGGNGVVTGLKEGNASIIVVVGDDKVYAKNTTIVTVTVKKVNTLMNVSASDITEGENATINVTLPGDASGNVTTSIGGKFYSGEVKGGKAVIIIPDLEYGNYTLPISYSGDGKYNPSTEDVNLIVKEDDIIVSAPDLTKYYSGSERFMVNVAYANGRAIAGKEVKITINGVTYSRFTDENGSASLIINLNSKTYNVNTFVDNITVNSLLTILPTIESSDIESQSKNLVFTATFRDGEGNYLTDGTSVSFNIGGVIYNSYVNGDGGSVSIDLSLDKGRYIITSYNPVSGENVSNDIAVDLKDVYMILSGDEITVGENATIGVTLPADATGNVTATINGKTYTNQVNNGKSYIIIPDLGYGNYTVGVTYSGDDRYNGAKGDVNVTVNMVNDTLSINAQNLTKYYKDPQKFVVTVTDVKGQVVPNKTVDITINGVTYKRTTDENGSASLNINLNSGVYPVRVVVDGVEANYTVTVMSTIDSSDIIKVFRNGTKYNAMFTDSKANPLANIKVSFNIHGIIYNRTTDKNGAANLDINLDAGDYIITAFNSATGEMKSNTIKVISLIESENLTKYYRNASQFVVRIHSADGGYVGAGEDVKFNINGVFYTRTTNATGHAKLNINLGQGNYTITTYYKDCSRGNNVEVLPILVAEDLSMKYMDGSQFKAQLFDGQGKAYAKQNIQFNINGVLYNRATDGSGVAKLNIRLMAGEYIITSSYYGFNISNTIKIST